MAKFVVSKKTKVKKRVLISILYHKKNCSLLNLLNKINSNNYLDFLIILDGLKKIKDQKKILKKFKNIKIIYSKSKKLISKSRNLAIKNLKKKHYLLIFLDSDVVPSKTLIDEHLAFHLANKDIYVAGGLVTPSFNLNLQSFWEIIDGCMSWFTSVDLGKMRLINFPYHVPTCNMSIKTKLFKTKIAFNENLKTGEDANFCDDVRKHKKKIALIPGAKVLHHDRKKFKDVLNHQLEWGKHQYFTIYKKRFYSNNHKSLFFFTFLVLFPFIMPILNSLYAILVSFPWIRKNFLYTLIFPIIIILYLCKGIKTYEEFLKDFKKEITNFK